MKKIDLQLEFESIRERIEEYKNQHKPGVWAELVGVSGSVVSNVHGKAQQKPSLEYIVAVSKATGRSVDYYLWGSGGENQTKPKSIDGNKSLLENFQNKDKALEFINRLVTIESINPKMFEMVGQQIEAVYNTAVECNPGKLSPSHQKRSG